MICLENPKINGGSTITIIQAKTTLAPEKLLKEWSLLGLGQN
jgi:hypothetical protein